MITVGEIMIKEAVCCTPGAQLWEPRSLMKKYSCTKIPVIDKDGMIIGGVTLTDLEKNAHNVVECMSKKMKVVEIDSTIDECLKLMILDNIEEVPVIDKQGHLCGMVTEKILLGQ